MSMTKRERKQKLKRLGEETARLIMADAMTVDEALELIENNVPDSEERMTILDYIMKKIKKSR